MNLPLPKRRKAPKMGVRQPVGINSPGHLAWVRRFQCAVAGLAGHECIGIIQTHHDRHHNEWDNEAVPLCVNAHDEVHNGHLTFEAKYKVNLTETAAYLWKNSPHRIKWERKQEAVA